MIRIASVRDIPAILEIYTPYILNTTHTFEYVPPTLQEFRARFDSVTAQCPWLIWEEDGQVLGYAYGSIPFERAAYSWCCEVSIYLAPEAQGKGAGRKLYQVLEHILFLQGYRVIYSVITTENLGSVAFHERVGYRHVAVLPDCGIKFGRSLGTVWMEKRANSVEIPSDFPVSWRSIVENDGKLSNILATWSLS